MTSLLIFDCDGVLVDSEVISAGVLAEALSGHGAAISEEIVYRRFLGRSMNAVRDVVQLEFGLTVGDDLTARMREEMHRRFRLELRPIRGVTTVLDHLTHRRCVASSSRPDRLRLTLGLTGLLPYFDPHIFSASMVAAGKPSPDLFLYAARAMDVPPHACTVIEDSPAGIEAAQAAGMRVFGFTGGAHAVKYDLAGSLAALRPHAMFDDMLRLPELLEDAKAIG